MEAWEREKTWQQAAIATAIVAAIGFVVAAILVLQADDNRERIEIVTIAAPFGVFLGAAVTFCTVVWRGLVSVRQTEVAQAQLAAVDENNLALLLQKGAELLADSQKQAHIAAGIATLQAVIVAKNGKFAKEAMELVADYIKRDFSHSHSGPLFEAARSALHMGSQRGLVAQRTIAFRTEESATEWKILRGVKTVLYKGGILSANREADKSLSGDSFIFDEVSLIGFWDINISDNLLNCLIKRAHVNTIKYTYFANETNMFIDCDFSGCMVDDPSVISLQKFNRCYFYADEPPVGKGAQALTDLLTPTNRAA